MLTKGFPGGEVMADNIRNFSDYRKRIKDNEQATEEINIEIQDPLDFLSADEREEYYRTQHEAMDRERKSLSVDSDDFYLDEDFHIEEPELENDNEESEDVKPVVRKKTVHEPEEEKPKAIRKKHRNEVVNKKSRKTSKKNASSDEEDDEIIPLLVVRISSIITGIIILILLGMIFKSKVYDNYLKPEPDEEVQTKTEVGELAGYSRTDDKIVTTADLNLRNTPSTASDDFIVVQVPQGTVLDRISVSDDGEWAQISYDGQLLFCVMKYATVQE